MSTVPRVEFETSTLDVDLGDQVHTMEVIKDKVLVHLLKSDNCLTDNHIKFKKITKNDNIKQTIERLKKENLTEDVHCLYSYGPHLQKLLSIVEIYKNVLQRDSTKLEQYNRLTCFISVEEGRNLLLEKKTRIPILIVFISIEDNTKLPRSLLIQSGFTKQ